MTDKPNYEGLTAEEIAEIEGGAEELALIDNLTGDDEPEAKPAVAPAEEAAKPADKEPEPEELRSDPAPILPTSGPKDAEQRTAAIKADRDALVAKFEDGDITAREYADGLEALNEKRNEIERERLKADIGREAHENAIVNQWNRDVSDFLSTTAKHIADRGERALLAFDQYVKSVTGDPKNANLSNRAQLDKAYREFTADLGGAPEKKVGDGEAPKPKPKPVIPPTLARLPAEEITETTDGRFAQLDRLAETDPAAYERAVSRLTDEERIAYER
ncbi:hypothetical protein [Methylosinus sp. PW1]|uniref:hypothetical protein n=1 Tax=Methylosinus sp. PW1 TaxID=107636 RepID=UPI00056B49CE|nr:hypothetical protein [Methylosinus sp. PW1]